MALNEFWSNDKTVLNPATKLIRNNSGGLGKIKFPLPSLLSKIQNRNEKEDYRRGKPGRQEHLFEN